MPLEASELSRAGRGYMSATSQEIPNRGQRRLRLKTSEGHGRGMTVQVAPVRKPLLSTDRLNDAGNDVMLRKYKPYIKNVKTGEVTDIKRVGRAYTVDMWVWVPKGPGGPRQP